MRSFVTTTRTSVSYGVGSPGLGDCWTSFNTGASRHTDSSNLPSRVIEAEESTTALALGASVPATLIEVAPKKRIAASQAHFCLLHTIESGCGFSSFNVVWLPLLRGM